MPSDNSPELFISRCYCIYMCMPMHADAHEDTCVANMGSVSCNVWHSVGMKKNGKNTKQNKEHKSRGKKQNIFGWTHYLSPVSLQCKMQGVGHEIGNLVFTGFCRALKAGLMSLYLNLWFCGLSNGEPLPQSVLHRGGRSQTFTGLWLWKGGCMIQALSRAQSGWGLGFEFLYM